MNRHVGASFTLSVLVVVFFAIVLYEPDHTRSAPRLAPTSTASNPAPEPDADPTAGSDATTATVTPSEPQPPLVGSLVLEPSPEPPPEASVPRDRSTRELASAPRPTASDPPASIQRVSHRSADRPSRHSAFTQVAQGESLTDVALRVYGTPEATNTLWRANRDILTHREAPLSTGLLLRTP